MEKRKYLFILFILLFALATYFLSSLPSIGLPQNLPPKFKDRWISRNDSDHSLTPMSKRSLLKQNQIRLERLRQQFGEYLKIESFYQPKTDKTMSYSCQSICAGWGDRVRGIISVYMLALLMRRRFMIDMSYPCPITRVLQPNLIDWTYISSTKSLEQQRTKVHFRLMTFEKSLESNQLSAIISKENFTAMWEDYDDILISTNVQFIDNLLKNPFVNASYLLGTLPENFISQEGLFPLMFELLFRPTDKVVQVVDRVLQRPYEQLICFHIRIGRNPTNPLDTFFSGRVNLTSKMIQFLQSSLEISVSNNSLIFVASDSDRAINEVRNAFPDRTITTPGPIIHLEQVVFKYGSNFSIRTDMEAGFVKVISEFYLLGECDASLLTRSGFSNWATRRRKVSSKILKTFS